MKISFPLLAVFMTALVVINACKHEIPVAAGSSSPVQGGTGEVCFESQILPIFQSNCAKSGCHDAASHNDDYIFDTYTNIIRKDIQPGDAAISKVYKVLFETGSDKMPRPPNPDLTPEQKALIGRWINEGAKNTVNCGVSCDSSQFKYGANISVILGTYCLGCHSGAAPSAGINLSTYANVRNVAISGRLVGSVSHAPGYSAMPKNASKLSACQIAQIRKWVDSGAPNN
jgi:uncharacterized membrane protein